MGQALCKRTLNIVESLNEKHGDRLHFYLSKADEAGGESDRQVRTAATWFYSLCFGNRHSSFSWTNIHHFLGSDILTLSPSNFLSFCVWLAQRVMMQIVQELCKRPGLNKCGFDMPTIYIPNPNKVRVSLWLSSRLFGYFQGSYLCFSYSFFTFSVFLCSCV